jgi:pyruvate kinase
MDKLIDELSTIRKDMFDLVERYRPQLDGLHHSWRESGENLLQYLALRHKDIRPLQEKLSNLGLSSLGRAESHVIASLNTLLQLLQSLTHQKPKAEPPKCLSFNAGFRQLLHHSETLLGKSPAQRNTRIMVTMPSEAATDYLMVKELVASGMDCMRINCAHDDEAAWASMIENLRRAKRELGKQCRVLMDLGGPKLRTGPLEPYPPVIKWRPHRDKFGRILEPARIWLCPDTNRQDPAGPADAILPLPGPWVAALKLGDTIAFNDARDASRTIKIVGSVDNCRWGEAVNTSYVTPGTRLTRTSANANGKSGVQEQTTVSDFPGETGSIYLHKGDVMILTKALVPGKGAVFDKERRLLSPPYIGCSLPEVFSSVTPGERIFFDDGKIAGVIKAVYPDRIKVEIISARPQGEKLGPEKGINLPDSRLKLSSFTEKDRKDLRFIVCHAHMVGMSFAQEVADISTLRDELIVLGGQKLGIVLKIETRRGFEMLPDLILAAMQSYSAGVMIARGDLAVECGYERLAEIQEEILWLCEAAHLPVIWATQVLENLAKTGIPSRAEITDAAMSGRAECVMLNKGPHVVEAVCALDNILQRMAAHQNKKSALLRQLKWWEQAQSHIV